MKIAVIGAGTAGYVAALKAAQYGSDVTLIEKGELGGTCLNVGCIPTKSLIENTTLWSRFQNSSLFKDINKSSFAAPWDEIFKKKKNTVKRLQTGIKHLLKKAGVKVIAGTAQLIDRNNIAVTTNEEEVEKIEADIIIVATGSIPAVPPIQGIKNNHKVFTSDEILTDEKPIEELCIIGGGAIGLEFAMIYEALGVNVIIVEMEPEIAPNMDPLIQQTLHKALKKDGIKIYTGSKVLRIEEQGDKLRLYLDNGQEIETSNVLVAAGRKANIEGLGLEKVGIVTNEGRIMVNKFYQTSLNNVYAIGDCSSNLMLAHVASREALIAVEHIHTGKAVPLNYQHIPQVIYTHPEAASVGLTLKQAKELGYKAKESVFPLVGNGRALIAEQNEGMFKIIFEEKHQQLLGFHLVAPFASEIINEATVALHLEYTLDELMQVVHDHPSVAESYGEVVMLAKGHGFHI